LHLESGEPDFALTIAEEAHQIARKIDYRRGQAAALQRQAMVHLQKEDPEMAFSLAGEARKLCRAIQDKQGETNMLNTMAHASLRQCQQSDEALKHLNQSNKGLSKEHTNALRRASREAFAQAKSSVTLARWMGDRVQEGIALTYLAQAHIVGGRLKEALKTATEAEVLFQEMGDEVEQVHALVIQAEVHAMLKNNDEAIECATTAMNLAKTLGDTQVEDRAYTVIDNIRGKPQQTQVVATQQAQFQVEDAPAASAQVAAKKGLDPEWVKDIVSKTILASVATDDDEIHEDSPLMEVGMDSLSSVSFRNGLNQQLGLNLPAALMFDYPSQRAIVDHVLELSRE